MPLGGRDILMIVRAVDQASGTLTRIGTSFGAIDKATATAAKSTIVHGAALTALGVGLLAIAKKGADALKSWAAAAADYNQEAALTLTQTDGLGISLEQVKKIGRDVAKEIPAPFEQMQGALYDIFSSMNVNAKQAQTLLTAFSKGAVAGQVDVQDAANGTIGVMNAFKIPIEDVNRVMDIQFQLVAKGRGTYEEFSKVLGRVAPSAVRMGQSFETVGGMLAFLTRNGLNTAQASTSAARALDTLSKVKVQERLEKMGISVRNAAGEYRPLVDIVGDMNEKFKGLTKPELGQALEKLFFGAGNTVAARRFFDTVFTNFDQFQGFVGDMQNSAGQMGKAYDIMFDQPQTKIQLLKNKLAILKTELGDRLLPAVEKLAGGGTKLLDFFGNLSEGSKDLIVKGVAIGTALAAISGVILTLVGGFMILSGVLTLAGTSIGAIAIAALPVLAILAALAAIAFVIYKNWDTLGPIFKKAFEGLKVAAELAWTYIQDFAAWVMTWLPGVWQTVEDKAGDAWDAIVVGAGIAWDFIQQIVAWLQTNVPPAWEAIKTAGVEVWQFIQTRAAAFLGWLQENVFPVFIAFADMVTAAVERIVTIWTWLWETLTPAASFAVDFLTNLFTVAFGIWTGYFQILFGVIMSIWEPLWTFVKEVVSVAFNFIKQTIENYLAIITGIFNFFAALFKGDWAGMWQAVKDIAAAVWAQIGNIVNTAFDLLFAVVRGGMNLIWQVIQAGWDGILGFLRTVPGKVWSALASIIDMLWDLGWKASQNMLDAIKNGVGEILGFMGSVAGRIKDALAGLPGVLRGLGADAIQGLLNGISSLAGAVADKARSIAKSVKDSIAGALHMNSPSRDMFDLGINTIQGMINGVNKMGPKLLDDIGDLANGIKNTDFDAKIRATPDFTGNGSGTAAMPAGNITVNATFHIYDANDAEATGKVVEEKLSILYRELQSGPRR